MWLAFPFWGGVVDVIFGVLVFVLARQLVILLFDDCVFLGCSLVGPAHTSVATVDGGRRVFPILHAIVP